MTTIAKEQVARAVYDAIPRIACVLPHDVRAALEAAQAVEAAQPSENAYSGEDARRLENACSTQDAWLSVGAQSAGNVHLAEGAQPAESMQFAGNAHLAEGVQRAAGAQSSESSQPAEGGRPAEGSTRGAVVLGHLLENAEIAERDHVPICQDTGTVWVCLEVGPDVAVPGDVFACVDEAVARAYTEARLRKSVVRDALVDRANTGDNTPAFTNIHFVEEPGARVHVLLKGGGSDNASRVTMLTPGAGREGIIAEVMDCVAHKAANACPPLVIGIGVGGTFDKVAGMAKSALLREVGTPAADPRVAEFERELLEKVNASGMGPGALGGKTLALAVHVNTAPCHIAALPLAINMGCSAMRRATVELDDATPSAWPPVAESGRRDDEAKGHMGVLQEENERADASGEGATAGAVPVKLALPLDKSELAKLKAGDACTLTGEMYMLRDAGHIRLLEELKAQGSLPYGLEGATIFYAGPTPPAAGRPFGAVGPTTASRMDFAAPALYRAGVVATVGKGVRSKDVAAACQETGSVYFVATGGAAALLAQRVESGEVVAYDDLGTEALRRITVRDFPVFVGLDTRGGNVYDLQ